MRKLFLSFLLFCQVLNLNGQEQNIDKKKEKISLGKKSLFPISLIGLGLILNHSGIEKDLNREIRELVGNDFSTSADDFLVLVPVLEMYTADALGLIAKNHWFDQSKQLFFTDLITLGIVQGLKELTSKTRPDGSYWAFPSGHSALAFSHAAILQQEFKDSQPIFAYSGFIFATATAGLRMANQRHWISDVIVGVGIALAVNQLVYQWAPLKNFNPFKKTPNLVITPLLNSKKIGLYLKYQFD